MAYSPQNYNESDGHFELLDDRSLKSMFKHLKHEMELAKRKHQKLRHQAHIVAEEIKRREGREEKNDEQTTDR